jgi:hypothetical protein
MSRVRPRADSHTRVVSMLRLDKTCSVLLIALAYGCSGTVESTREPTHSTGQGGSSGVGVGATSTAGTGTTAGSGDATTGGVTGAGGSGGTAAGTSAGGSGGAGKTDVGAGGAPDAGLGSTPCPLTGAGHVRIAKDGAAFTLFRDDAPFYIKGIDGQARMDLAQQYGANSTRTYSSGNATSVLNNAKNRCLTVMLGIELSKNPADYANATYTGGKRTEVTNLLASIKDHPALLVWAIGNEINLGADVQQAWQFVGELAGLIHGQDPNHPVITVVAGSATSVIDHVAMWATGIDAVGINSYGAVMNTAGDVAKSTFTGPFIVTEWGPTGHWESPNTSWMRPIEQTSAEKALVYQQRYDYIFSHRDRALGSYVFLWGQKQERTPTWYGMFLENSADLGLAAESCPTVDTMAAAWTGITPSNRAPAVSALTLDGKRASDSVTLTAGQMVTAEVTATDPDGDALSFSWEILQEPTQLGTGGSAESRPPRVGAVQKGTTPTLTVAAPGTAGEYRLFVYALDGKGHAGTANVPFRVN